VEWARGLLTKWSTNTSSIVGDGSTHMKLRGSYPAKVDEKGRLKIPVSFLDGLKEYGEQFYITSFTGDSARIYPLKVWSEIEDKLAKLPSTNKAKQKFLLLTSYFGQVVEMDAQGRLLMPAVLREKAHTVGDVAVLGALDYLEVVNDAKAIDQIEKDPMTDEDYKELGDLGV
jgi:MraZ protein